MSAAIIVAARQRKRVPRLSDSGPGRIVAGCRRIRAAEAASVTQELGFILASRQLQPAHGDGGRALQHIVVTDKYDGTPLGEVALAGPEHVEEAIAAASAAREPLARTPTWRRQVALEHVARRLQERSGPFADALTREVGKTLLEAQIEVARAIEVFRTAAGEAARIGGEVQPLDMNPRSEGMWCIWRRVPLGVCSFITPFNFPLNLAAHKIAPAIAAGCPWILKPALNTPLTALMLGELLAECDLPRGTFSILPCTHETADPLVTDERIGLLSFTGSPAAGWALKARAGRKRVALELGGNAACIVDADANLDRAAARITAGAFGVAGQSCISVQRVLAHRSVYGALRERLVARTLSLKVGNPRDPATAVGPMISVVQAQRAADWLAEAVAGGGRVLCGGACQGALFEPTLVEGVPPTAKLACEEVFAPIAILDEFSDFDEALRRVNASRFGLQAGIFTGSLPHALQAHRELHVGAVILNDVPTTRVDAMPYGGVKESGAGREGVRFAIEEMTELRTLVFSEPRE
ncbi:MAG: aldehyde dehydrogenase family protein [Phycisphaerales bacterium]|nr:aldehyde dehydrogenase family protein [Phycisphaerales bacterium]